MNGSIHSMSTLKTQSTVVVPLGFRVFCRLSHRMIETNLSLSSIQVSNQ